VDEFCVLTRDVVAWLSPSKHPTDYNTYMCTRWRMSSILGHFKITIVNHVRQYKAT